MCGLAVHQDTLILIMKDSKGRLNDLGIKHYLVLNCWHYRLKSKKVKNGYRYNLY